MSWLGDRIRAFLSQSSDSTRQLAERLASFLTGHIYLVHIAIGALLATILFAYASGYRIAIHEPSLIDWASPQEKAAITLSDPQVYSREALINDRRRETEYLEKLLRESEGESFRPHIRRTIDTIHALELGVGASGSGAPAGNGTGPPDKQSSVQAKNDTKPSEPSSADSTGQKGAGYPQERFRELQAYRNDIRASLARATLDDLHDYNGQALYRLQFHATVFPGKLPNKFGIAELRVIPPSLEPPDVKRIYLAWLGHATLGLNPPIQREGKASPLHYQANEDPRYQALAQRGELLELMEFYPQGGEGLGPNDVSPSRPWKLRIAVPPNSKTYIETYLNSDDIAKALQPLKSEADANLKSEQDQNKHLSRLCSLIQEKKDLYDTAVRIYHLTPYIAASLRSLSGYKELQIRDVNTLRNADSMLGECPALKKDFKEWSNLDYVPDEFRKKLNTLLKAQLPYAYAITPSEVTQRVSNVLSATTTLEMALALQQNAGAERANADLLGNAKETLEGLERIPLIVGFSSRTSKGNSNGTPPQNDCGVWGREGCATFGWVFGPKYRTYSKDKGLEHVVASYDVAADVSIPGWWPIIPMQLRTFWVENWNGTSDVLKTPVEPTRDIQVRIPLLTPPDLESLTGALMTEYQGPWGQGPGKSIITRISPSAVSACSREVTFVIQGDNLWRDAEVYWEGIKGDQITVLPGMEGITAHFTLDSLFGAKKLDSPKRRARKTSLLVATRGQQVTAEVMFYGHRYNVKQKASEQRASEQKTQDGEHISVECDGPILSAEATSDITEGFFPPRIHAVTPAILYACRQNAKVSFVIEGENLAFLPQTAQRELEERRLTDKLKEEQEALREKHDQQQKALRERHDKERKALGEKRDQQQKALREKHDKEQHEKLAKQGKEQQKLMTQQLVEWEHFIWNHKEYQIYLGGNKPNRRTLISMSRTSPSRDLLEAVFENAVDISAINSSGLKNEARLPISVVTPGGMDTHDVVIRPCDSAQGPEKR